MTSSASRNDNVVRTHLPAAGRSHRAHSAPSRATHQNHLTFPSSQRVPRAELPLLRLQSAAERMPDSLVIHVSQFLDDAGLVNFAVSSRAQMQITTSQLAASKPTHPLLKRLFDVQATIVGLRRRIDPRAQEVHAIVLQKAQTKRQQALRAIRRDRKIRQMRDQSGAAWKNALEMNVLVAREAASVRPLTQHAKWLIVQTLVLLGRVAEALPIAIELASDHPDAPNVHLDLAELHLRHATANPDVHDQHLVLALAAARTGLANAVADERVNAYDAIARVLLLMGQPDQAAQELDVMGGANATTVAMVEYSRGNLDISMEALKDAKEQLDEESDDDDEGAGSIRGELTEACSWMGLTDEAIKLLHDGLDVGDRSICSLPGSAFMQAVTNHPSWPHVLHALCRTPEQVATIHFEVPRDDTP